MNNGRIAGKVALVTGGASGMGEAIATRFVREGGRVIIADMNADRGMALAGRLGNSACFIALDVRSEENWNEAVAGAERRFGAPLDILVNCAGVLRESSLEDTSPEEYRFLIDVMQVGVYLGMRAAAPSLRRAGGGSIVNISSTAGIVGYPSTFAYTAAKWAVRGMTKAAALDLAPDRIRVNSIHPGNTETPMIEGFGYSVDEVPLKRNATADEIANLTLFLASDESQYITAAEHVIDGGLTAY
jgi:3alpha(or 20beta)-hydroxysteroid dehydrogenase